MPLLLMPQPIQSAISKHTVTKTTDFVPKEESTTTADAAGLADIFGSLSIFGEGRTDSDDAERKCEWLRSEIIGGDDAGFEGPFGWRRITYADHAASGRCLRFVEEFLHREVLPFYGNTHTVDSYVGQRTSETVHEATRYVKSRMGAGPHDALLFCGSGSTAAIKRLQEVMGVAVPSVLRPNLLHLLPTSSRWVVFTGPFEHHSNLLSWRQSLAEVVEIPADASGIAPDIDALKSALDDSAYAGRPKLGSFSACSNVSGVHADARGLARALHERGAYACFDFACSGPYVDIDMRSGEIDGYDAVFLSPHKFIGGPGSPGVLLLSEALYGLKGRPPSTSGGGTVLYVNGYGEEDTLYCEDLEEREDAGTPPILQKVRAALAYRVKDYMGQSLIKHRESVMVARAMERLLANPRVRVLGNTRADRLPVVSFLLYPPPPRAGDTRGKHLHCRFVTRLLNDLFGVQARGGCACAGPYGHALLGITRDRAKSIRSAIEKGYEGVKPGWTRVSFSYYSTFEELDFVLDSIEFLATYGLRFLPLYRFEWTTGNWAHMTDGHHDHTMRGSSTNDIKSTYSDYLRTAKQIADGLSDAPDQQRVPDYINRELVDFRI